jgi:hypothetical protein
MLFPDIFDEFEIIYRDGLFEEINFKADISTPERVLQIAYRLEQLMPDLRTKRVDESYDKDIEPAVTTPVGIIQNFIAVSDADVADAPSVPLNTGMQPATGIGIFAAISQLPASQKERSQVGEGDELNRRGSLGSSHGTFMGNVLKNLTAKKIYLQVWAKVVYESFGVDSYAYRNRTSITTELSRSLKAKVIEDWIEELGASVSRFGPTVRPPYDSILRTQIAKLTEILSEARERSASSGTTYKAGRILHNEFQKNGQAIKTCPFLQGTLIPEDIPENLRSSFKKPE